ncbi:unnamed protein product [Rangifer tarandus platyrhynchus]|uniref:Uncharacterized protein n=1 Tax=Rangifer tarandus platyrhynchus TaxID=3082113 RepID=A0AC59Y7Q3_RANTA
MPTPGFCLHLRGAALRSSSWRGPRASAKRKGLSAPRVTTRAWATSRSGDEARAARADPAGASTRGVGLDQQAEALQRVLHAVSDFCFPRKADGDQEDVCLSAGVGGRGRGRGGVRAVHSQVINARFLWGAAAFPWQRSASQLPRSVGCRRLRCKWSSSQWPPRQPASSCSWYSSSSSQSTSALGLSTSLCPRTVKCKKKSIVARGAPNRAAHHEGRYLLHPTGPEAVLASAPRPRCGDARHGFRVHRPWGLVSTDINQ